MKLLKKSFVLFLLALILLQVENIIEISALSVDSNDSAVTCNEALEYQAEYTVETSNSTQANYTLTVEVVYLILNPIPISGATVEVYRQGTSSPIATATTDKDGKAYFYNISSSYQIGVNIRKDGYAKRYYPSSFYLTSNRTLQIVMVNKVWYPDFVPPYASYTAPSLTGQHFGWRSYEYNGSWKFEIHKGIDISRYTPYSHLSTDQIGSVCDGIVVASGSSTSAGTFVIVGYGYIQSEQRYEYYVKYYHLVAGTGAQTGYDVVKTSLIGKTGASGQVTGKHLHIEISDSQPLGSTNVYDPNAFFN